MFSYVQKQEGRSIRKDNSLTWKSQIHEFGRRHYNLRYTKDSRKIIKGRKTKTCWVTIWKDNVQILKIRT